MTASAIGPKNEQLALQGQASCQSGSDQVEKNAQSLIKVCPEHSSVDDGDASSGRGEQDGPAPS
jgi:hypothetical protein